MSTVTKCSNQQSPNNIMSKVGNDINSNVFWSIFQEIIKTRKERDLHKIVIKYFKIVFKVNSTK